MSRDNNEVIISMLEEKMYSRDEVIRLLNDAYFIGEENAEYSEGLSDRAECTDFNKWIEENL